ncbi:hypothetical protein E3U23_11180 [Erythrobacter litoralis]|uniref:hypothetical protein n=1 Tax=Erythrobacter litoralis TaxID=39960 RepID=UPI002435051E|nr:hypothetical protein [Erythrobacter litoralis]MDG6079751.1 hypothetical protein [Erythrobacter litoralis]
MIEGVGRRRTREAEAQLTLAWQTAAFTLMGQTTAGLKPLDHYLARSRPRGKATPKQMLSVLQDAASRGMPMTIRKVG